MRLSKAALRIALVKLVFIGCEGAFQNGEPTHYAREGCDLTVFNFLKISKPEVMKDIQVFAVVDYAGRPYFLGDRKSCNFFLDPDLVESYYDNVTQIRKSVRIFPLKDVWFKYNLNGNGRFSPHSEWECRLVRNCNRPLFGYNKSIGNLNGIPIFDSVRLRYGDYPSFWLHWLQQQDLDQVQEEPDQCFVSRNVSRNNFTDATIRRAVADVNDLVEMTQKLIYVDLRTFKVANVSDLTQKQIHAYFRAFAKADVNDVVLMTQKQIHVDFQAFTLSQSIHDLKEYMGLLEKRSRDIGIVLDAVAFNLEELIIELFKPELDELIYLLWSFLVKWLLALALYFLPVISRYTTRRVKRSRRHSKQKPSPRNLEGRHFQRALPDMVQGPVTEVSYRDLQERALGWVLLPFSLPLLIALTFLTYPLSVVRGTWQFTINRDYHNLFIIYFTLLLIAICIRNAWKFATDGDFVITPYTCYVGFFKLLTDFSFGIESYRSCWMWVVIFVYGLPSFSELCLRYIGINAPNHVHYIWKPIFCSLSFWGLIWDTLWPILDDAAISKYEPEQYNPISMLVVTHQRKWRMFYGWGLRFRYVFHPKLEYKYVFEPEWSNPILLWFFRQLPLNHGTNFKLYLFAKHYRSEEIKSVVFLPDGKESESVKKNRLESLNMLKLQHRPFSLVSKNEEGTLKDLKDFVAKKTKQELKDFVTKKGAGINFPNNLGQTMLHDMCHRRYNTCIDFLLSNGAYPNPRDIEGCTPIHYLVAAYNRNIIPAFFVRTRKRIELERKEAIELFLQRSATDISVLSSCDYIEGGASPYMMFQDRVAIFPFSRFFLSNCCYHIMGTFSTLLVDPLFAFCLSFTKLEENLESLEALRPKPSWGDVEKILKPNIKPEQLCQQLSKLIEMSNPEGCRALHRLRLRDMLFCKKEGKAKELRRRQKLIFERFLKPALERSAKEPMIDDKLKEMLNYVFIKSEDPRNRQLSRSAYQSEFEKVIEYCNDEVDELCRQEAKRLMKEAKKDPDSYEAQLMEFDEETINPGLVKGDLNHGRFMKAPSWALEPDLAGAIRGLHQVGVMDSIEMFCELIQQGRHPLLPTPNPRLFHKGPSSPDFWIALVLFWSIGIQKKIKDRFDKDLWKAVSDIVPAEAYQQAEGVKEFPRSFEKALEYVETKQLYEWEEKVCAGLHVIDGLRCRFVVNTPEENIALGQRLEERFPIVRTKNKHRKDSSSYADRKYSIVYSTAVEGIGKVAFICEVQIMLKRYFEISKFQHLHYEFKRSKPREPKTSKSVSALCWRSLYLLMIVVTSFPGFVCMLLLAPKFDFLKNLLIFVHSGMQLAGQTIFGVIRFAILWKI